MVAGAACTAPHCASTPSTSPSLSLQAVGGGDMKQGVSGQASGRACQAEQLSLQCIGAGGVLGYMDACMHVCILRVSLEGSPGLPEEGDGVCGPHYHDHLQPPLGCIGSGLPLHCRLRLVCRTGAQPAAGASAAPAAARRCRCRCRCLG